MGIIDLDLVRLALVNRMDGLRLLVNAMFTAQALYLTKGSTFPPSRLCSLAPLFGRKDMQD